MPKHYDRLVGGTALFVRGDGCNSLVAPTLYRGTALPPRPTYWRTLAVTANGAPTTSGSSSSVRHVLAPKKIDPDRSTHRFFFVRVYLFSREESWKPR